MNNKSKTNKGITLIALIITVIVLLILAGTAVSIAINGGDLFGKASGARNAWNTAVAEEQNIVDTLINYVYESDRVTSQKKVVITSDPVKGTYTSGNITIYLQYGEDNEPIPNNYELQYQEKASESAEPGEWTKYTGPIEVSTLGKQIRGRLYNSKLKENQSTGESEWFIADNIDREVPEGPTQVALVSQTETSITVEASGGSDDSGVVKYQYSIDNGTTWEPTEGTTESYTFSNLTAGQSYVVIAKALDNAGKESTTTQTATIDRQAPSTPTGITLVEATIASLTVQATGSTDDSNQVKYQYSIDNGATWVPTEGTTGNYTFSNLNDETNYTILAKAIDNAGNVSVSTTNTQVATLTLPTGWSRTSVASAYPSSTATQKAPIPKGFVASSATGENAIATGLVIYKGTDPVTDSNVATAQTTRDQYVWIPVANTSTWTDSYSSSEPKKLSGISDSRESTTLETQMTNDYTAMQTSVSTYGGFYISRYELGCILNQAGTAVEEASTSRKGQVVYNAYNSGSDQNGACWRSK